VKKKPKTILTDQDASMAKAISLVMPETRSNGRGKSNFYLDCIWVRPNIPPIYLSLCFYLIYFFFFCLNK
jgi:hypothetical protein